MIKCHQWGGIMKWLKYLIGIAVCFFLLYAAILCGIMSLRYGRNWIRYEKAWDEIDSFHTQVHHKFKKRKPRPMKTVTIYTDGACSGNPGPGGWGAILMYGSHKRELSGGEPNTTNNRMELTAVIQALSILKEPCIVDLWSDSKYVIDGLEKGWAKGWKARGWVKSDKKPALNPDLWEELLRLTDIHSLRYHWVKGHAENEYNNRCDELAVAESQRYK